MFQSWDEDYVGSILVAPEYLMFGILRAGSSTEVGLIR
jgi:hypothetical protein